MNDFFPRIKIGCLNDHYDLLGGGTVHSFKFIEYLKRYYDVEVNVPGTPKSKEWMRDFLHLDTEGLTFFPYTKGCGNKYNYLFLNMSHWRAEPTNALKKFMLVFFPQFFFPLYDYEFLANSEYTKKNIVSRWKQDANKVHVVYPPIMTSQFNPQNKLNGSIVHVSRITPPVPEADKGHRQMIQAFKEMVDTGLKGWTFHIVGQIQDQVYYEELYRLATGYPIIFHPGISFAQLQNLYGEADIYWHMTGISLPTQPGAQEHFGMTTVESMASGCVPVVLNTGGQPEIVKEGKTGFLVENIKELKEKTLQLIKNKGLREKMSIDAIKRSKDFDEEVMRKTFYSLITKTDKVSIIMLCYNNSQLTKDCVNRLYEVTPEGFELILVDNDSKDDTWKVIQGLQKKYPNIKTIHNDQNVGFAKGNNQGLEIATGEYICHLGHLLVETNKGNKPIKLIKKGDLVKTHTGKFKKVLKVFKRKYTSGNPITEIVTNMGDYKKKGSIRCTPEHPFLIKKGKDIKWIQANKLTTEDKLLYPYEDTVCLLNFNCDAKESKNGKAINNGKQKHFGDINIDKDLARFLGLYLAEGSSHYDSICFTFNNNETDYIKFISDICITRFNRKPTISKRGATTVKLNITSFGCRFKEWFGAKAPSKRIPEFVFNWSLINRLSFIYGYAQGDGYSRSGGQTIVTASKELNDGFIKLCNISGIQTSKSDYQPPSISKFNNLFIKSKGTYHIVIKKQDWIKLTDLLFSSYDSKNKFLEIGIRSINNKLMPEYPNSDQFVYNIEVEEDNSYIINSSIVHNCHLNNDTVPQWGWLERMIDVLEAKPEVGIVGARLYFNKDDQGVWKIQHAGVIFKNRQLEHIGHFQPDNRVSSRGVEEVEAVTGACLMVRKELAGFDEGYIRGYYEDMDLCLSVREKGFKVVINHEARLIHLEGPSLNILKKEDKKKFDEVTEKNRKRFEARWHADKISHLPKINMTPDLTGIEHEEKVEIGGGERPIHVDYAQVDLKRLSHIKYNNDARILPFPSNTLTDICACYSLNCFSKAEAEVALREWYRCLKPGGRLELYVPDLNKIAKDFISTRNEELLKEIYGYSDEELETFKWGYSFEGLDVLLSKVNFVRVSLIKPISLHPNSLGVEAFKPL